MNIHQEETANALLHAVTTAPAPIDRVTTRSSGGLPTLSPVDPQATAAPAEPAPSPIAPPAPTMQYSVIRQNYSSLAELGGDMLEKLRKSKATDHAYWDQLLTDGEITKYLTEIESRDTVLQEAILAIETAHRGVDLTKRQRLLHYYTVAFLIADDKRLYVDGKQIADIASLASHTKRLLDSSYGDLERFCHKMVDYDGILDLQLEAWLTALGKQNELNHWRTRMTQ